jgi:hypothetical protein
VRLLSQGLAGTDPAQQLDFARAAEDYRRLMVKLMNEAVMKNSGEVDPNYRGTQALSRRVGRDVWEKVPPFVYAAPGAAWVLGNHRWSVAALLLWGLASVVAAMWTVVKFRIE